jgi:5S rRNA maturation endonuclease (ribonuclease M5)
MLRDSRLQTLDKGRAERLLLAFQALNDANEIAPIIVEGRKDADALRKIGVTGKIIPLHQGRGLYEFCEEILERYERVILLIDWDEKGDQIFKTLSKYLKGLWEEFSTFREMLKALSQKEVSSIEAIPSLLKRLTDSEVKLQNVGGP